MKSKGTKKGKHGKRPKVISEPFKYVGLVRVLAKSKKAKGQRTK